MINNFDVLKRMSADNRDIRMAPSNLLRANYTKAGTQVTMGVEGNVVGGLLNGNLVACLLLWDREQFNATKAQLEQESAAPATLGDGTICDEGLVRPFPPTRGH
jgi:hypothetical protein